MVTRRWESKGLLNNSIFREEDYVNVSILTADNQTGLRQVVDHLQYFSAGPEVNTEVSRLKCSVC